MSKRSSIMCSRKQREKIDDLKKELAIALGKESKYDITDRQFVQILLDTYLEYKNKSLLSLAKELTDQLEGIISLLNIAEDYERLQQENEELRKELEELKKRKTTAVDPSNYEECYQIFLKALSQLLEEKLRKGEITDEDVHNGFVTFMELFKSSSRILEGLALLGRASRVFNVKL